MVSKILSQGIDTNFYPPCLVVIRNGESILTPQIRLLTYRYAYYFSNVFRSQQYFVAKNSLQVSKDDLKHRNTLETHKGADAC